MMFNNSGNIGLPLAYLAWGEAALPAAVVLFMVENTCIFPSAPASSTPGRACSDLWRVRGRRRPGRPGRGAVQGGSLAAGPGSRQDAGTFDSLLLLPWACA